MFKRMTAVCALAACVFATAFLSGAFAFSTGYRGIALVAADVDADHEAISGEALRHFCEVHGVAGIKASPIYRALFERGFDTCAELAFDPKTSKWVEQMGRTPNPGFILGSRYPDFFEMAALDAQQRSVPIVNYKPEVDIDIWRLSPFLHWQLSKYHNIYGGDQVLAARKLHEFVRASVHEATALALSGSDAAPNHLVAPNSMWDHDAEQSNTNIWFPVRWNAVQVGVISHMIADSFSHDPLIALDGQNNRLVRGALFYGRFRDAQGRSVGIETLQSAAHPNLLASLGVLYDFRRLSFSTGAQLDVSQVPPTLDGQPAYLESNGRRFMAGALGTSLSAYAVSEYLSLIKFALENPEQPQAIETRIDQYIGKYLDFDFGLIPGFTPEVVRPVPSEYRDLPWHNYQFADLWTESDLADRDVDGKFAFVLPWTDRASAPGLARPQIENRFVLVPADEEAYDAGRRILKARRDTVYLFKSWYRTDGDSIRRVGVGEPYRFEAGRLVVDERELDFDGGAPGLDDNFAFAWVPPGCRLCLHLPYDSQGRTFGPRTAAYDRLHERYRCFYGGTEGHVAHMAFHLPRKTRLLVLPIDTDHDGVPFLAGQRPGIKNDNCPFDANPDQTQNPCGAGPALVEPGLRLGPAYGGGGGLPFDDLLVLRPRPAVQRIELRGGDRLDAVKVTLADGMALAHGGSGGSATSLTLATGEALLKADIRIGRKDSTDRVFGLTLTTNRGRTVTAGKSGHSTYTVTAPPGYQIVGFAGRSGREIDKLGVVFAPGP